MREFKINHDIRANTVRLVTESGDQIVSFSTAIQTAYSSDYDLVEVGNDGKYPVCKMFDYKKYIYEQKQKQKENERKSKASKVEVKEIRLRPVTDTNDINIKARSAAKFLNSGDKVKITVQYRGREVTHQEKGNDIISKLLAEIEQLVGKINVDQNFTLNGKSLSGLISKVK